MIVLGFLGGHGRGKFVRELGFPRIPDTLLELLPASLPLLTSWFYTERLRREGMMRGS